MTIELHLTGADQWPKYIRLLVVGAPGVGKTTAAAKFPNPIFANAGAGLTSLAQLGKLPFVNITSEVDLYELKTALDRPAEEREVLFGRPIDTLVIDCLDEFQRSLMGERLINEGRQEFDYKDWNWIADRLNAIFGGLDQLDMHVVVICHSKDVNDGDAIKPNILGSFSEGIFQYVDTAVFMHAIPRYKLVSDDSVGLRTDDSTGEVTLEMDIDRPVSRYFHAHPRPEAEWIHSKLGALPVTIDGEDLFSKISDLVYNTSLGDSETLIIDPDSPMEPVQEPTEPVEVDEVESNTEIPGQMSVDEILQLIDEEGPDQSICADCNTQVSSETWKDLSHMKFGKTLCGSCYKNQ